MSIYDINYLVVGVILDLCIYGKRLDVDVIIIVVITMISGGNGQFYTLLE